MSHDIQMFDPAIRHPQSILVRKILRVARRALDDLPEVSNVFGVNSLNQQFQGRRSRLAVLEDPEGFFRPVDFSAGRSPTKTAATTESLGPSQIRLASPQSTFGLLAFAVLLLQIRIEVSVLQRDRGLRGQ